jgi:hypothetical protein
MAKSKVKVEKFDRINRSSLKLKDSSHRTRTGASKGRRRVKAHSNHSSHTR